MVYTNDKRKIAVIGAGMVGTSFAYSLLNQGGANELVLIDANAERATGEAMDLSHGLAFAPSQMNIYAGGYEDCADADIAVITAGAAQKEGEDRLSTLTRNVDVFADIIPRLVGSGFDGILLVATNPVDIMTHVAARLSGIPTHRVIGSGTTLDTARLRYLVGRYFSIDPRNVHAYVIGEHGDSEMIPWSQAMIATKNVSKIIEDSNGRYSAGDLEAIGNEVRTAAYRIISAKKATYYGIGMALSRITSAIFNDERSILTVSAKLEGEYGEEDIFIGTPCVLGRGGVEQRVRLCLTEKEAESFSASCELLRSVFYDIRLNGEPLAVCP